MERFEAVIVGSGYGGSICAARLAAAGVRVLVLERGRRLAPGDLQQSDDPKYIQSVVASDNVAFRTGKLVGGASIPMDGAHFRMPRRSFAATDRAGRPYWPDAYSRASLDPYYERAEQTIGVRQFGWHEISRAGGLFARMLDAAGASCDRARMNYTDCVHCGFCAQGCGFGKKNDLPRTYLPIAEAAGAEIRAGAEALELEPATDGYVVRYRRDGAVAEVSGARVIVAAGGIHSPALLLRSRRHLDRLPALVGKGFNNNGEHSFIGILPPESDDLASYRCFKGADNAAVMSFHWMESEGFTLHPGGGLEPSIFASALAAADSPVLPKRAWGMEYKRFVESVYPHRLIAFSSLGLADSHRSITVDAEGRLDLPGGDRASYDAYLDRLERIVFETGARSGVTLLAAVPRKLAGMTSAHLLAACRMAERPEDGAVDPDGQLFGYENLYVVDASIVPYAIGVNPALTISAVAERVAERMVARG